MKEDFGMKRKWISLICLLAILCMLPLESLAVSFGDVVRISNKVAVNVRKGPGTNYGLLGEAQPTNLYVYLGEEDGWYRILYRDQEGYVAANRVTVETGLVPDEYGTGESVYAIVRVTHSNKLNVRSGPGKKYKSLGQVSPGTTWDYAGMDDGWNIIYLPDGQLGYIAANRTEVEVVEVIKD